MNKTNIDSKIANQIKQLEEKYSMTGQDLSSYLDGLLHADYLTYWDYIHLDTLLSLQTPRTNFKDEPIFIMYHQITELYLKLILSEIEQIADNETIDEVYFLKRIERISNYIAHLGSSFSMMIYGMEKEQFLKFRMSLLPASGFQSAQIRLIELCATDTKNLVHPSDLEKVKDKSDMSELMENLYWKSGATELATGKKTLTLIQFEEKYMDQFRKTSEDYCQKNLWQLYYRNFTDTDKSEKIRGAMRKLDVLMNISWRLAHYKSAVRYLHKDPEDIAATGGTNWQKYLPPRFQKIIFFPELWSEQEKEDWGKSWVFEHVLEQKPNH